MNPTLLAADLVVGASLALSGAALQSVLGNPLAEPYILGLVGGASLGVAVVFCLGLAAVSALLVPAAAFLGACLSLSLVCLVSVWAARRLGRRALSGSTVVVAGFVAGSFTNSLQMLVLSFATPEQSAAALKWVWGDLQAVQAGPLALAGAALAVSLLALVALSRKLDVLALGEDVARSLGVNVRRTQLLALGAASLATAISVALAGAVGFVGLIVPHATRRIFGVRHGVYLPVSALLGGVFLVLAQGVARFLPGSVPLGVVCALAGAPFFLWLLTRRGRA
ncbi:MAG: FecCD family ABC transporter permease [Kiritimatiellia bacterium]